MSVPPHTNLFTEVDRSSDPDFFVRFMDEAQKPAAIQTSKQIWPGVREVGVSTGHTAC
jgi:hypothetical protein